MRARAHAAHKHICKVNYIGITLVNEKKKINEVVAENYFNLSCTGYYALGLQDRCLALSIYIAIITSIELLMCSIAVKNNSNTIYIMMELLTILILSKCSH